ncbi:MAG TPA: CehA/McbA family metallohydrolase [Vicinamibacteria bacterium]|nr:CehA/McbA family metallohydrolase [Vicinamibacteria bacterium]
MKRPRGRTVALLAGLLLLVSGALHVARWRPVALSGAAPQDGYVRVPGVVHVHTTLSDGAATPPEVIAAARASGLKFVAITDHNTLAAKEWEGYHDGVLVLVGTEISTTAGHVVGLGMPDPPFRFSGDARDAFDDVYLLGGHAFVAHPTSPRPDFRWTAWDMPGPWGIELINGDSQWRAAGWTRLARTLALYPLNHRYALLGSLTAPTAALAHWDEILARRPAAAIAGADAHGRVPVTRTRNLRFPSYESLLGIVRNHVLLNRELTGEASVDVPAIVRALSVGRSYVGLDALAEAGGFSFTAVEPRDPRRRPWSMGDVVPPEPGLRLRAGGRLPEGARITLRRDGRPLAEAEGSIDVEAPGPGVYRVEVHVPGWGLPWVISNPISVFAADEARRRGEAAAWPPEPPAPPATRVIDAFEGPTTFHAEVDPSSAMEPDVIAPNTGPDGSAAARIRFRLGAPGEGRPYVWCALVSREARDLTGGEGLVFAIRGDRRYRIWVQVRDANPASADEGTEWWFASVRTEPDWRRVAVPFADMRSLNPKTDGRLDLGQVRQVVFVLDAGAVEPGTEGTIEIDDLALY